MELTLLLDKLRMDHLEAQLDAVCEEAARRELDYKNFLAQALGTEWQGRYRRGIEARLRQSRFPWVKTLEQFDFDYQPSIDRRQVLLYGVQESSPFVRRSWTGLAPNGGITSQHRR